MKARIILSISLISAVSMFSQPVANQITKYLNTSGTFTNSSIFDNSSFIGIGGSSALSGEYVGIQKAWNGWTALRIYNSQSGTAASSSFAATAAGGVGVSMTAYNTSYTSSGIFEAGAGVLSAGGAGGMNIGTNANYQMSLWTNNTKRVTVDNAGLVGIADATPTCRLDVTASSHFAGMVSQFKTSSDYAIFMTLATPVGSYNALTKANDNGIFFDNGTSGNSPANGLVIAPWNHDANGVGIRIDGATGNVGIGTNNATATLTVKGNALIGDPASVTLPTGYKLYVQSGILTEKVKVALINTSDWSDYVFARDYKLKPLSEVASFVEQNKHLPGVPSAQELVDQGGFDLGKMDAKLLEKIEELTLYVIELNKQNKELTERLEKLESNKK